jgi:hypothetical protein
MPSIPWRLQLVIVAAAYAAGAFVAAILLYSRHMQYLDNPAEATAASGMYAGGDLLLELFIGGMFFIPTFC